MSEVVLAEQIQAELAERRKKASALTNPRDRWRSLVLLDRIDPAQVQSQNCIRCPVWASSCGLAGLCRRRSCSCLTCNGGSNRSQDCDLRITEATA